ncbi:unnamed protein product, partial [Cylindrotheca closterium]
IKANSNFGQDDNSDYDEQGDDAALAFNVNQLCLQQPKELCQKSRAYNFQKFKDIDRNCMNQRDLDFVREQMEAIEKELFQRKAMAMKKSQKRTFLGATNGQQDMVSFSLNTETCKKSYQDTYHRKKRRKSGK